MTPACPTLRSSDLPLVVRDDADRKRAVAVALDGAFFGSGQRCTASSRLVVTAGIHDRFVALLGEKVRSLKVGHALDPNVQVGPVASDDQLETVSGYLELARAEGRSEEHTSNLQSPIRTSHARFWFKKKKQKNT